MYQHAMQHIMTYLVVSVQLSSSSCGIALGAGVQPVQVGG